MRKYIAMICVTLMGLVVINASPSYAATCGSTSICFYNNSDGTGLLEQDSVSIRSKSVCYTVAPLANDLTSYIVNGSGSYWYVFSNGTCSSTPGTIYPHSQGAMVAPWNNSITSYYRAT